MSTRTSTDARELSAVWRQRIDEQAGRVAAAERETEAAAQLVASLQASLNLAQAAHRDAEARQVAELHHLADIRRAAAADAAPAPVEQPEQLAAVVELFPGTPKPSEQLPADVAALAQELAGILPASLIERVSRDFLAERADLVAEGREEIAADDAAGAAMLAEADHVDEARAALVAELDALAVDTYPHRDEDAATLCRLGVADDVAGRVLDYLAQLNEQDAEHCKRSGYWFARSSLYTVEQPTRARQLVRLMYLDALAPADERRARTGSVVCFLDIRTGQLRQADGWKKAGPRVLADLTTEAGAARFLHGR